METSWSIKVQMQGAQFFFGALVKSSLYTDRADSITIFYHSSALLSSHSSFSLEIRLWLYGNTCVHERK